MSAPHDWPPVRVLPPSGVRISVCRLCSLLAVVPNNGEAVRFVRTKGGEGPHGGMVTYPKEPNDCEAFRPAPPPPRPPIPWDADYTPPAAAGGPEAPPRGAQLALLEGGS